jgi:hypothetical protein
MVLQVKKGWSLVLNISLQTNKSRIDYEKMRGERRFAGDKKNRPRF